MTPETALQMLVKTLPSVEEGARVDVAINVYGKPLQTAVALYTLLKHSGKWINNVYFIEERQQPFGARFDFIREAFAHRIIYYRPPLWLGVRPFQKKYWYKIAAFRKSLRYQYAWEHSKQPFLFTTHNDMLYRGDIVGAMLESLDSNIAIGQVGQCWNCSAFFAGQCDPQRYRQYRPDYAALKKLMDQWPGKRQKDLGGAPNKRNPWPLPECRLNEWAALIHLPAARSVTRPIGSAIPFGAFHGLDVGGQWFRDVLLQGNTIAHFDIHAFATHGWTTGGAGGHSVLSDVERYNEGERMAGQYLLQEWAAQANHFTDEKTTRTLS